MLARPTEHCAVVAWRMSIGPDRGRRISLAGNGETAYLAVCWACLVGWAVARTTRQLRCATRVEGLTANIFTELSKE